MFVVYILITFQIPLRGQILKGGVEGEKRLKIVSSGKYQVSRHCRCFRWMGLGSSVKRRDKSLLNLLPYVKIAIVISRRDHAASDGSPRFISQFYITKLYYPAR